MTNATNPTAKQRWAAHKNSRMRDLRQLFRKMQSNNDAIREQAYEDFNNYALAFDYVAPGTFSHQKEGYWRYQISWGGPSDEIRFYASTPQSEPYAVIYSFMDWFDGEHRELKGRDLETALNVWRDFQDTDTVQHTYDQALENA